MSDNDKIKMSDNDKINMSDNDKIKSEKYINFLKLIDFNILDAKCKRDYLRYDKDHVFMFLFKIYPELQHEINASIEHMSINKLMCLVAVLKEYFYCLLDKNIIYSMKKQLAKLVFLYPEILINEKSGTSILTMFRESCILGQTDEYFFNKFHRAIELSSEK